MQPRASFVHLIRETPFILSKLPFVYSKLPCVARYCSFEKTFEKAIK